MSGRNPRGRFVVDIDFLRENRARTTTITRFRVRPAGFKLLFTLKRARHHR
jgi:hypothetical protein